MGGRLHVGILGPFEVRVDGDPVALGGLRQRAVLALLTLRANEPVSTGRVVDALWGETPPSTAMHTIQVFVSRLRRALGAASDRLVTARAGYLLRLAGDELDAARYERLYTTARAALAAGDANRAATVLREGFALWRGAPLADFAYEEFAREEILRLEALHLECREELIEARLQLGQHGAVVPELEALVAEHPFRERLWGQLMRALYRCGRQADALAAFRRARQQLVDELGMEPLSSLRELEQAILRQDPSLDHPSVPPEAGGRSLDRDRPELAGARVVDSLPAPLRSSPTTPFVGREAERETLRQAVEDVQRGARRVVVVAGEPGIGKTRLVAEAALTAHADGLTISWAAGGTGLDAPYALWLTALSQLLERLPAHRLEALPPSHAGQLARLIPPLQERHPVPAVPQSDPETERYMMFQAVVALFEWLTTAAPVVVVLDDVQWADEASLGLLDHVARATAHLPLLLILTYRHSEVGAGHRLGDTLAGLHRLDGADQMILSGLSRGEVVTLMTALTGPDIGAEAMELVGEIAAQTDGTPFFVVQMLRHLRDRRLIARDEQGRWNVTGSGELSLPHSVREVIAHRVNRLGERPRSILAVAAVAGAWFDFAVLERVVEASEAELLDALEAAVRAVVLVESRDTVGRFGFAHALFRTSLYEDIGLRRRAAIHRRVAEALEHEGSGRSEDLTAELARHWLAAGSDPEKAIGYAQRAGEQALSRLAPDQAARWFGEALKLLATDSAQDGRRCDLLIGLGEARRQVGDPSFRNCLLEASGLAERLDDPARMTRAAVANTLGPFGAVAPPDHERIAALERVLNRVTDAAPQAPLVKAILAKEVYFGGQPSRGIELAESALAAARRHSQPRELARVMSFTVAISSIAPLERHVARVDELARLGDELADPEVLFRAATQRFLLSMHAGERPTLDFALNRMRELADAIEQPILRWTARWMHSAERWVAGDLGAAEKLTMEAAAVARAHSIPEGMLITFGQLLAVRIEQQRLDEVVELLERQAERNPGLPLLQLGKAFVDAECGRLDEAGPVLDAFARDGFEFPFDRTRAFNLARCADIALRLGAVHLAPQIYRALLPYRDQFATTAGVSSRGSVELPLGRLASALGRHAEADAHLEAALRAHARFRAPLLTARTHLAVGESLLARGDPALADAARDALSLAATIARDHGSRAIEREASGIIASSGDPVPTQTVARPR